MGFCAMLWKLMAETKAAEEPTHLAVIFDAGAQTFRNDIYDEYKANRPPPPEELVPQFPLIRDAVKAFGVACIEEDGFEADDLIATYAKQAVGGGRRRCHRVVRQGPDAARRPGRRNARHDEKPAVRTG